jgi:hypothetical protein
MKIIMLCVLVAIVSACGDACGGGGMSGGGKITTGANVVAALFLEKALNGNKDHNSHSTNRVQLVNAPSRVVSTPVVSASVTQVAYPVVQAPQVVQVAYPVVQAPPMVQVAYPVVQAPPMVQVAYPVVQAPPMVQVAYPVVQAPPMVQVAYPVVQATPSVAAVQYPLAVESLTNYQVGVQETVQVAKCLGGLMPLQNAWGFELDCSPGRDRCPFNSQCVIGVHGVQHCCPFVHSASYRPLVAQPYVNYASNAYANYFGNPYLG